MEGLQSGVQLALCQEVSPKLSWCGAKLVQQTLLITNKTRIHVATDLEPRLDRVGPEHAPRPRFSCWTWGFQSVVWRTRVDCLKCSIFAVPYCQRHPKNQGGFSWLQMMSVKYVKCCQCMQKMPVLLKSYNGHAPPPGLHDWRPFFDPTQTPCDAQTVLEMVHTSPSKASLPDGCVFVTELQKPWWFLHPLVYTLWWTNIAMGNHHF